MSRKRVWTITTLFVVAVCNFGITGPANAQYRDFTQEIRFIQYLIDKEEYREADYLLGKINPATLSTAQSDTVNYLRGWSAYTNKKLDTAITSLLKVSPSFPAFLKSHFFAAYSAAFLGKRDSTKMILADIKPTDSVTQEMKSFQLSGLALLNRDYPGYEVNKSGFSYSLFALQKEEERFNAYYAALKAHKHKSPFLAGVYSALLPGAGKFYAGKKKQGIAAFLPILSLGVITYEAYRKSGIKSARTIAFGSIFSVFYIGNIWGSVLSVKIKDREFYREYDNKILFDLHIPLRNLYN